MNNAEFVEYIGYSGHVDVQMPNGDTDDYDFAVPDSLVQMMFPKKKSSCEDSYGSQQEILKHPSQSELESDECYIKVRFHIDKRIYEFDDGTELEWDQAVADLHCRLDSENMMLIADKVTKFEVDGENWLGRLPVKYRK